jgi:Leucine-rich repeat (LRR) protein
MKKLLLVLLALPFIGFGQNVNIPDVNFKAYLVGNTAINTNGDTEIQVSEANAFTGTIDCSYDNISNLTGIEAFTALTYLDCRVNQLSSLDVSQNTALTELQCDNNQLTSLNVSQNTALTYLYCYDNQLSSLNVSQNTALTYLVCHSNQLSSLDVSQNTALTLLSCHSNQLSSLNVRNGNNTNFGFFAFGNPNLTCIDVDNVAYSTANWTIANNNIDSQSYFSNNCPPSAIQEQTTNKELLKITDLLGRETKATNQLLFYIYNDGTVEKKVVIE